MIMETILSGLLGLMIGGMSVGVYCYTKTSKLYSQVLDKQTIIKLIKEHMASVKPKVKKVYRKKPIRKYTSDTTRTSTKA